MFFRTFGSFRPLFCTALLAGTMLGGCLTEAGMVSGGALFSQALAREPEAATRQAPSVTRATLPNGLRVVVVQDKLAPVVTTELNYLVGSSEAPAGFPGTAHALEHMMFRGSKGLDKDQLAALGARIGGSYNADTTEDVTQYYYTAPAEDLDVLLRIEALRMKGLTLSEADWDKERGAIEQEVSRDLSSPAYRYISQLQSILFKGTPYEHDALGTRPSFDKTDAALLRKFYEQWYAPNNAILVIAGDVDPDATIAKVRDIFGPIPSKTLPERTAIKPAPAPAQTLTFPTDYPVGFATIAFPMPGQNAKDFAAADILSDVLASQRGALYQLVPAGKALFAGFEFAPKKSAGFGLALAAFPKGGDSSKVLTDVRTILSDIRKNGVPAELVEAAKTKEIAQLGFSANSVSGLAESWSEALAFKNLQSPEDMIAAYRAVTPEDVNRMAAQLLDPDRAVTAILTPENSGKPIEGKGFGGAESFASAPDKPVKLPDWAEKSLARLDIPEPAKAPVVQTLPNGLTLIVHPSHVSQTIEVAGLIRHNSDLQEPKGKEGVSDVTEELFGYGTQKHDRLAFRKALDDVPAWESAGAEFSLRVPSNKFEQGMSLLAENELQPAFPDQAFQIVRQQAAQEQAGQLQSPGYLFGRAIMGAVSPKGDPSLREATPKTLMGLSLNDVKAYYSAVWRPDMTTIVVTGDITPGQARTVVEKAFGSWKATGPKPVVDLPTRPDSKTSRSHVPDKSNVQDTVVLPESLGLTPTNPDHFLLTLGNEVLGGGFSSRLYRDLRVKTGYVYSVSSSFDWSRNRGAYSVSYGADPDKVGDARKAALRNIHAMQVSPVTDDELIVAKSSLLRGIPLGRASLGAIAGEYLRLIELGLPLDTPDIAAHAYYKATAADVQAAFSKWVRPDDLSEIVKGPQPRW
ncbi:zinc protease [Acetobacter aceti NBRC 14818]|nr:pitrilysin family protein [Acetobacter aceti]TCS35035.1 zinc protease [Acetobacter aceti NBRC 14818]